MTNVQKKESESNASLIRRFTRKVKQANVVSITSARRFYKEPQSSFQRRKSALRRIEFAKKMNRLRKLGKVK